MNKKLMNIQSEHGFVTENDIETKSSKIFQYTENPEESQLKIFSGSSHRELAKEIVSHLDV